MASIARSTRPGPGTSNGGLTAHPRGDRWSWESRIFGGAYDQVPADQRPKYGALNFRRRPAGGSPRFGSAHFRLNGDVLARTTFCYPDSVFDPVDFGVASAMSLLEKAERDDRDVLDDYIEAQVHGPVVLTDDVEALVLDSCHRGTEVEWLAAALPCPVEWHDGFRLSISEMGRHPAYRGGQIVALGRHLARQDYLDAQVVGEAARTGMCDTRPGVITGSPWMSSGCAR